MHDNACTTNNGWTHVKTIHNQCHQKWAVNIIPYHWVYTIAMDRKRNMKRLTPQAVIAVKTNNNRVLSNMIGKLPPHRAKTAASMESIWKANKRPMAGECLPFSLASPDGIAWSRSLQHLNDHHPTVSKNTSQLQQIHSKMVSPCIPICLACSIATPK